MAMLQGKELHIEDNGNMSNSWSDFLIGLRSRFVTLRHDDDLIMEPYSPHRFSRQFGFFQDFPGGLVEQHYDGSLLALVQLWDSCVRLGSSSKIIIPMRPSNEGPLMTREYSDWWQTLRENVLRQSTHIILKGPRKDDVPSSIKSDQRQLNVQGKSSHSSKSKATLNNPPQTAKATSKYKTLTGKDTQAEKKVRRPSLIHKAAATASEVINISHKRKETSSSSYKGVEKSPSVAPLCKGKTKPSVSPNEVGITSAASSSNESNVSQEQHWRRLKKKPKDLGDQNNDFVDLDSISIDTAIFGDGADGSTIPLTEYAQQLGLGDISGDIFVDDISEDCITIPNPSNTVKSSHPSLDNVKAQVTTEGPSTKLNLPLSENVDHSQPALTNEVKAGVNQVNCPNVSKNVVRPLQHVASNFDPQEPQIVGKRCCLRILKGNQEVDVTDITPLEVLFEKFFKKHGDYDVVRSSTSQKMTRDSHQELLSAAQRLHTATKEKIKMNKRLGELQFVLAKTENELEVLTAKKKKTTLFIDEQQK
ncbi:hypothetical protein K7X08_023113 [Anisodus acutangulus]|uniref:Aminotransferase-like plant mobile domain-containing protein n=1 Tax=Anisodus acutangulus TaxID=402998 RepID=A0A9Q1RHD1_9SOLA|nr:hypothetical protein K7X08_023113 [Anisodus acutangulus]